MSDADLQRRARELAERLRQIDEELADLGIEVLRGALERREPVRPPLDRAISSARRSVERAARSLDDAVERSG
jgi:hypothetical protein